MSEQGASFGARKRNAVSALFAPMRLLVQTGRGCHQTHILLRYVLGSICSSFLDLARKCFSNLTEIHYVKSIIATGWDMANNDVLLTAYVTLTTEGATVFVNEVLGNSLAGRQCR